MRWCRSALAAVVGFVIATAACGGGGTTNSGGNLYPWTCADACQNRVTCGASTQAELDACVTDCSTEPWPGNARACYALTCGRSDAQCEQYSVKTCEQACQKMVDCGLQAQADYDACVADCRTEPWPGIFIDCRATLCGATEVQCETFTGS
jgi:hypothetical protein